MKYVIALNVVDRKTGRPTPLKVSCEFRDLSRKAAVAAMIQYAAQHGIAVSPSPSSIRSIGAPQRRAPKVRLPGL